MGKRDRGVIRKIIDGITAVLTLAAAAAIILAYIAPSVSPNRVWIFAYAGLAAPILYLGNLFLMLYWAIRWKPLFFLPAVVLLVGMPKIKAYYHLPDGRNDTETALPGSIGILTCNAEGFLQYDKNTGRRSSTARQITAFIRERNPDIVCIQEFQSTPNVPESAINEWLSEWPHRKIHYTIEREGKRVFGLAVYSKFPIVSAEATTFPESSNGVIRAELLTAAGDTLRVICNHLETTYVKDEDISFLQPAGFAGEPDKSGHIRQIAGRLRRGFRKRAHQADSVARWIASRSIPTLVCGDFNDPPVSYTYRTIRGGYGDAFEEKGRGYGYTYKKLYRLMRIDYILRSPQLETLSCEIPDVPWSDHNPVIAAFRLKQE